VVAAVCYSGREEYSCHPDPGREEVGAEEEGSEEGGEEVGYNHLRGCTVAGGDPDRGCPLVVFLVPPEVQR